VLAPLRKWQFFSLAEINKAVRQKVAELNDRAFRGEPTSRRELFEELERPALKPLPAKAYELAEWKRVSVNIDYHVEYSDPSGRHCYSVPYTLVHQKLEVRATKATVEVYKGGRRVASHPREHGRRRYITDPAHMPPSHRAHLEWTPSLLVSWASTVSPHAAALAEKMLASRPHPEHSYRACLGLMNLAKRYGNERLRRLRAGPGLGGHLLHLGQVDPGPEPGPGPASGGPGAGRAREPARGGLLHRQHRKGGVEAVFASQTTEKLEALGLHAMAAGLSEQLSAPGTYDEVPFADRLGLLVDKPREAAQDPGRVAVSERIAQHRVEPAGV
jgi:hypothetical protein